MTDNKAKFFIWKNNKIVKIKDANPYMFLINYLALCSGTSILYTENVWIFATSITMYDHATYTTLR